MRRIKKKAPAAWLVGSSLCFSDLVDEFDPFRVLKLFSFVLFPYILGLIFWKYLQNVGVLYFGCPPLVTSKSRSVSCLFLVPRFRKYRAHMS